jgi:hypothetical protein
VWCLCVCRLLAGTLGAICFSYVMYMSLLILWGGVGTADFLQMEHGQIDTIFYPSVVTGQIGIVVSSLGQALQCLVVAPRLLCSIAVTAPARPSRTESLLSPPWTRRANATAHTAQVVFVAFACPHRPTRVRHLRCHLLCAGVGHDPRAQAALDHV